MNIKSATSTALLALSLAAVTPAQANSLTDHLNHWTAAQSQRQNQTIPSTAAASINSVPSTTNRVRSNLASWFNHSNVNRPVSTIYNTVTPAASFAPVVTTSYQPVSLPFLTPAPLTTGLVPFSTANNLVINPAIAPEMNILNNQAAQIEVQLSVSTNPWQTAKLEKKLAKIQAEETALATTGSPYLYNTGVLNTPTNFWRL